jgi:hypothetical protein
MLDRAETEGLSRQGAPPALAILRPVSKGYRFTVDLRPGLSETELMASRMLPLVSPFQTLQGSNAFAKIDLYDAYWQLALDLCCQENLYTTRLGLNSRALVL